MKNLLVAIILFFPAFHSITAQSTDRFIRIIGNASHTFMPDGIKAEVNMSEIQANENRQIKAVPFEAVYSGFIQSLTSAGLDQSLLTQKDFNTAKYGARSFILTLDTPEEMNKLKDVGITEGVKMNPILYTYKADPNIEEQLITQAIDDAKRKAMNICREIDMQLGKILNIEDASTGCCGEIKDSKESTTTKTYTVSVTFELKD